MASNAGYAAEADRLAVQYESVSFAHVHRHTLHLFPDPPGRVLDIGAGTGRDAAALAARGHRVVAAEPTAELRAHGQRLHADQDIEWLDDALPELPLLTARDERFDLILASAVWMHLDPARRRTAMARVTGLLAPGGRLVLSLRHGPVPAGRRMFEVPAQEVMESAREHGLAVLHHAEDGDSLGRDGIRWSHLCLGRDRAR
ncbi:class I SAM-dependent methyltransferase [Streptomyces sp. NPDC052396]|uniref:class I SAM-dependent methyltransferase n=1 Tax=Streptomyces sp. NPDC052396 TaxID=3365689 RepID=UPI0037D24AEB